MNQATNEWITQWATAESTDSYFQTFIFWIPGHSTCLPLWHYSPSYLLIIWTPADRLGLHWTCSCQYVPYMVYDITTASLLVPLTTFWDWNHLSTQDDWQTTALMHHKHKLKVKSCTVCYINGHILVKYFCYSPEHGSCVTNVFNLTQTKDTHSHTGMPIL